MNNTIPVPGCSESATPSLLKSKLFDDAVFAFSCARRVALSAAIDTTMIREALRRGPWLTLYPLPRIGDADAVCGCLTLDLRASGNYLDSYSI